MINTLSKLTDFSVFIIKFSVQNTELVNVGLNLSKKFNESAGYAVLIMFFEPIMTGSSLFLIIAIIINALFERLVLNEQ